MRTIFGNVGVSSIQTNVAAMICAFLTVNAIDVITFTGSCFVCSINHVKMIKFLSNLFQKFSDYLISTSSFFKLLHVVWYHVVWSAIFFFLRWLVIRRLCLFRQTLFEPLLIRESQNYLFFSQFFIFLSRISKNGVQIIHSYADYTY